MKPISLVSNPSCCMCSLCTDEVKTAEAQPLFTCKHGTRYVAHKKCLFRCTTCYPRHPISRGQHPVSTFQPPKRGDLGMDHVTLGADMSVHNEWNLLDAATKQIDVPMVKCVRCSETFIRKECIAVAALCKRSASVRHTHWMDKHCGLRVSKCFSCLQDLYNQPVGRGLTKSLRARIFGQDTSLSATPSCGNSLAAPSSGQ